MTWAARAIGPIGRPGGATSPETEHGKRVGAVLAILIALGTAGIGGIVATALPATAATGSEAANHWGETGGLTVPGQARAAATADNVDPGLVEDPVGLPAADQSETGVPSGLGGDDFAPAFGACPLTELQQAWGPLEPSDRLVAEEEAIRLCTERSRAIADLVAAEDAARRALARARAARLDVETLEAGSEVAEQGGLGSRSGSGLAAVAAQSNSDDVGEFWDTAPGTGAGIANPRASADDSGRGSAEGDFGHLPTVGSRLDWDEEAEPSTGEGAYPVPSVGASTDDSTDWTVLLTARAGDGQWRARIVGARRFARDIPAPVPAPADVSPEFNDPALSDVGGLDGNRDGNWNQAGATNTEIRAETDIASPNADPVPSAGVTPGSPSGAVSATGSQAATYRRTWFSETVGPRVVTAGADLGGGRKVSAISATGVIVSIQDPVTGATRTTSLPWNRTGPATLPATLAWEFAPVEEMEFVGRTAAAGFFQDDDPWADDPAWETVGPTEPDNGPDYRGREDSGRDDFSPRDSSLRDNGPGDRGAGSASVHSADPQDAESVE